MNPCDVVFQISNIKHDNKNIQFCWCVLLCPGPPCLILYCHLKSLLTLIIYLQFFQRHKRQWQLSLKSVSIVQSTFWKISNIFIFKSLPATFRGIPTTSWSWSSSVLGIRPALTFHSYKLCAKLTIYFLSNN